MNAIKMMLVDIRRSKFQILLIGIIVVIFIYMMSEKVDSLFWGILYMNFIAVILAAQPFQLELRQEAGFLYLLPVTRAERITGRYLYGACLLIMIAIMTLILGMLHLFPLQGGMQGLFVRLGICSTMSLIVISVQYLIFYAIGRLKSLQLAGIIMMAPGFIMFFGISYLIETRVDAWMDFYNWVFQHLNKVTIISLAVGICIWTAGIAFSYLITRRRDYL